MSSISQLLKSEQPALGRGFPTGLNVCEQSHDLTKLEKLRSFRKSGTGGLN